MVKLLGFYSELDAGNPMVYADSMKAALGESPSLHEEEISSYLENGIVLIDMMEACLDVMSEDRYIPGGSSVLTDGEWVWRLDLPHYVRRYHLRLDSAFIDHVSGLDFVIPKLSKTEIISVARYVAFEVLRMK